MARYIGKYVKHPPIAESRIIAYDEKQVIFWYKDTKTKKKITVTMDEFEFIQLLLSHIPEKILKLEGTLAYIQEEAIDTDKPNSVMKNQS